MNKIKNIILFIILFSILLFFSYIINGNIFPDASIENVWFYGGIVMVLFSMFFIEPYYTAPKNVITNSSAILLVLLSIKSNIPESITLITLWTIAFTYSISVLIISITAMILSDDEKSPEALNNKIAEICKIYAVKFGNGKVQYSGIFLIFIFFYYNIRDIKILCLLIFWWLLIVIEPQKIIEKLGENDKKNKNALGKIFRVQSRKIFIAKLYKDKPQAVRKFDTVEFNYSMEDYSKLIKGIVFDNYFLNQEKWIKILQLQMQTQEEPCLEKNEVYLSDEKNNSFINEILNRFVGVVIENSDIGIIKFEYSTKNIDIQEGDLIEIEIKGKNIFYQVINGITDIEPLEEKNETGFIKVEAIQLGVWNTQTHCFEKYGWVPEINSIVLKASTTFKIPEAIPPEYKLGRIPNTEIPFIINLEDAISHHIAILGVTGSGKSFISREILKNLINTHKVICVDFTGEYLENLSYLNPNSIIDKQEGLIELEEKIAQKADSDRSNRKQESLEYKKKIQEKLTEYVTEFIESEKMLGLFELPDLSNTSFILEFTQMFLESVFKYSKNNVGKKICIVIEEAHTVVPETTSLGDFGDYSSNKALVNKIGQIALQGRKYGVGFMVIAQRTANVSKTVLTQCNSVICFQAFDKTSYDFLGNYLGQDLIKVLPNLKQYHAICVGKAFKSNIPLIVDLTKTEND